MPRLHDQWTVLPHGPLREIDDGLLTVAAQIPMPLGKFPRRMTVVGLTGGRTAIFSPVPLVDSEMARIEALGEPAFLIIPSASHRLDARPFKARYPNARVVAPAGARDAVGEAVAVDTSVADFGDPAVAMVEVAGTDRAELALEVRRPSGLTLITNDIIGNVRSPQGMGAWLMARLMGFGVRRPQIPRIVAAKLICDPAALAGQLEQWAELPTLRRIIPSHGEPIEQNPAAELHRLAVDLLER